MNLDENKEGSSSQSAWILRISPSGIDRIDEALNTSTIIIGWADAGGLLDETLDYPDFRRILEESHYSGETNLRRAGAAAGNMWRFIKDMSVGDYVVVPVPGAVHIAEIISDAYYDESKVYEDMAYRREVVWKTSATGPIDRTSLTSGLFLRTKIRGTSASAKEFVDEIKERLDELKAGKKISFEDDLRAELVNNTQKKLIEGRIHHKKFEYFLAELLRKKGASEVHVRSGTGDEGIDVIGTFRLANLTEIKLGIQAKHFDDRAEVKPRVIEKTAEGAEAEGLDIALVVTTGTFSQQAVECSEKLAEGGMRIELIDGVQLAGIIVDMGIPARQ